MNKLEVKKFFEEFNIDSTMQRVDATHPLDIYLGLSDEGYKTLFVFSSSKFPRLKSSKGISIVQYKKQGDFILTFKLVDNSIEELFYVFCADMIDSTRRCTKLQGNSSIINRYLKWQSLFAKRKLNLLSEDEIKGLIGELIFLKEFAIKNYGETDGLSSWVGPFGCDQDYSIHDVWYEIKSVNSGTKTIDISSLEQLDCKYEGHLVVVELDKTSNVNDKAITLNTLIASIMNGFQLMSNKDKFESILFNFGYVKDEEYDEFCYKLSGIKKYCVGPKFPKLLRTNVPNGVVEAKYEISTASIKDYYEGDIK